MTPDQPTSPNAPLSLDEWCRQFAPTLPIRFESVVAEWGLDVTDTDKVRDLLLTHVRQATAT